MGFKKILVAIVILTAAANALLWAVTIPYNEAYDEYTHFQVAEFIAEHNRLPVFGRDENMGVSKYEKPGFRAFYNASYSSMPPLAYLIQAGAIKLAKPFFGRKNYYLAARFSSVGLMLVFGLAVYWLSRLVFDDWPKQLSLLVVCLFIPQVTFTFSGVNSDGLALVLGTILVCFLAGLVRDRLRLDLKNSVFLGLLVGLTGLSRYNAFVLFPFVGLVCSAKLLRKKKPAEQVELLLILIGLPLLVSGWWYYRNLRLYQSLLANHQFWQTVYMLHPPQDIGRDFYTLAYVLFKTDWLWRSWQSFWASFGWNYITLAQPYYRLLLLTLVWAVYGLAKSFSGKRRLIVGSGLLWLASLGLSLWQSWQFAFQPQGRYLFPVLGAVGFLLVQGWLSISQKRWWSSAILGLVNLGIIGLNLISFINYIIPAYY